MTAFYSTLEVPMQDDVLPVCVQLSGLERLKIRRKEGSDHPTLSVLVIGSESGSLPQSWMQERSKGYIN